MTRDMTTESDTVTTQAATNQPVTTQADTTETAAPGKVHRQVLALAIGIAVPTALYYVFHALGMSNLTALSLAAILPSLSAVYNLLVRRKVEAFSLLGLASILVTIVPSLIAHDPRFLLARDGLITGLWGCWFFATLRMRRPAAFLFARPLMEGRKMFGTRPWEPLWETSGQFRRIWRFATVVFGTGLLVDAVIRVAIAYMLPVSVVPAIGGALWPATFVLIQVLTNIYYHRAGLYRILGASWAAPG